MDRLSIVLTLVTGPVLVGGLVIAVLSLGYYGWIPIGAAVVVGMFLTWPVSYVISRWIKRDDPDWNIRGGNPRTKGKTEADFPEN